jgi:hypothetical protein
VAALPGGPFYSVYGSAGVVWCVHDNQLLLSWAAESMTGYLAVNGEVG